MNSAPDGKVTLDMAKNDVQNEEERRKRQGSSAHSDILVVEKRGEKSK